MYRLCVKYDEATLEHVADDRGYANADEMCEDLCIAKNEVLIHFTPIDVTAPSIYRAVYKTSWKDKVYAFVRVDGADYEPFLKTTTVWPCHVPTVVWIDEDEYLADDNRDRIIPIQSL